AESASGWGFSPDSIGIMGSSAGGHLASVMASSPHSGSRPAFQLLFYPVITLDKAYTHSGTRHNFLPESADDAMAARFSSENNVTASTPPAFIVHCGDDTVVPVENALFYYNALHANGVASTLLIYPHGGHGWGFRSSFGRHDEVLDEIRAWLGGL
ncbi:MAG: alpha/beta hydrolase, partial [Muribaculaceae bacterium]|nr:alpha/beta hydrolase [Muribaculaceae bacterium]